MGLFGIQSGKEKREQAHAWEVENQEREQRFNAEQAQIAYDRQREFYDYQFAKESAYNSPLAQMQRYKQAGLNPFMMTYDSGSTSVSAASGPQASGGSASTSAGSATDEVQGVQLMQNAFADVANQFNAQRQINSQIALNKSAENKNIADAVKTAGVDTDVAKSVIKKNEKEIEATDANINLTTKQAGKIEAETDTLLWQLKNIAPKQFEKLEAEIKQIMNDVDISQRTSRAQIAEMLQSIKESVQRVKLSEKQTEMVQKELSTYDKRVAYDLNLTSAQFSSTLQQMHQLSTQNKMLNLKNELLDEFFYEEVPGQFEGVKHKRLKQNPDANMLMFKSIERLLNALGM